MGSLLHFYYSITWLHTLAGRQYLSEDVGVMGFRDMKAFNLAWVAKEACKLVKEEHPLAFDVLKAKYFSNECFLEAWIGGNLSLLWRGFMEAKNHLHVSLC